MCHFQKTLFERFLNLKNLIQSVAKVAANFSVGYGMYESGSGMVEYNAMMTGKETPGATDVSFFMFIFQKQKMKHRNIL